MVKTLHSQCRRAQVRSLVGELRSPMPHSMTKKKKKSKVKRTSIAKPVCKWETENMGRLSDLFKAAPEIDGKARQNPEGWLLKL